MSVVKAKPTKASVEQRVTDAILAALDKGTAPWKRPWIAGSEGHRNIVSGKQYRGINPFLLEISAMEAGYSDPRWLTFKQMTAMGGRLIGEKGDDGRTSTLVVFWKIVDKDRFGEKLDRPYRVLRHYNVFNVEQVVGVDFEPLPSQAGEEAFEPVEAAQAIVQGMPDRPSLGWGGDRAFYSPSRDHVQLPKKETFVSPARYYSTAFHELAHSTGHEKRLGRDGWNESSFGSASYSREELVAEMTAAMLCGHAGIADEVVEQSAAYLKGWASAIRGDDTKKLVITAAAQAQRAVDFILDRRWES